MSRSILFILLAASGFSLACSTDNIGPVETPLDHNTDINVGTVDALYAAVNDSSNAGRRIMLAPGVYTLDGSRPNGGRIELQRDMALTGKNGDAAAVAIDATNLSTANLTDGSLSTGAVRLGRGSNSVEWLTVRNALKGSAAITTDLLATGPTTTTIAHVIARNNAHGLDIRNTGVSAAGRMLQVVLIENELVDNVTGVGQGIRVANLQGANGASIHVVMTGNYVHGNIAGLVVANQGVTSSTVVVDSNNDRFDSNGNGAVLIGGFSTSALVANGNVVRLSATSSHFEHNTQPLGTSFPARFGIGVYGGVTTSALTASSNVAELELHNAVISDNGGPDVAEWGAISSTTQPAGARNLAVATLWGSSSEASVDAVTSAPAEPVATNLALFFRAAKN